ncbi:hypothetical protein INS49_004234 [Diaporthe citri]|uniref:uncharacterized protein n=1 Tax=Diaporthe citri TaxID=83186 RepID=UPI001C807934|nr:uncharacterized protein INS49_004234 [Diaporthe citri]KAG6355153.1 hypothetical protein INS49_004234 [Diaporthe citri]
MRWWGGTARISIDIRDKSVPKQWLLEPEDLPSEEQHAVLNVPAKSDKLTTEEIEMTNSDVESLLEAYRTRKWTVRQVITAFLKKAVIMNQMTNFATEFLQEDALKRADELDAQLASTGLLAGPLHGIPTSLAEPIPLAGRIAHAGIVSRISRGPPPAEDAHLVRKLRQAGAVVHLRTNVAQALVGLDCENNIMGCTLNPRDLRLSAGGSCGGEGVSVGAGCSVLGVGADVGGGVPVPAAFGGCYGFRPTASRVPMNGVVGPTGEQKSAGGVAGPLARSVDGLEAWMKAVLAQAPRDADTSLASHPWRSDVGLGGFTVGVMWDDGIIRPHPPVLRALRTAVDKLKAVGVRVVDWEPCNHQRGLDILASLSFPDGGQRYLDEFDESGEPALPSTRHAFGMAKKSDKIPLTAHDTSALRQEREKHQREHDALMKDRGVDFILGPAYVGAGALQGSVKYPHYSSIWDILDMPSVVLPSGLRCDKDVDVRDETYNPRSDVDKKEWRAYDPDLFDGFPIALQLAGKRVEDEEVLAAARVLEKAMKGGN